MNVYNFELRVVVGREEVYEDVKNEAAVNKVVQVLHARVLLAPLEGNLIRGKEAGYNEKPKLVFKTLSYIDTSKSQAILNLSSG